MEGAACKIPRSRWAPRLPPSRAWCWDASLDRALQTPRGAAQSSTTRSRSCSGASDERWASPRLGAAAWRWRGLGCICGHVLFDRGEGSAGESKCYAITILDVNEINFGRAQTKNGRGVDGMVRVESGELSADVYLAPRTGRYTYRDDCRLQASHAAPATARYTASAATEPDRHRRFHCYYL